MHLPSFLAIPKSLEVQKELFELGYKNLKIHLLGHLALCTIVGVEAISSATPSTLASWVIWMIFVAVALCLTLLAFKQKGDLAAADPIRAVNQLKFWRWAHLAIVCSVGIGWGCVGFLLVPGAERHNLIIFIAFAGTVGYSSSSNGPHDLFGFALSASIALLLLMTQIPKILGFESVYVIGMSVLYLFTLTFAAYNSRRTLLASIELKLANQQLAEKNAEVAAKAEQANRDKSDFLAAASHDLRQPVHALQLLIEAHRQQEPIAAAHPLMHNINDAGKAIGELFSALMEISQLENGTEQPAPSLFDITEVIERVTLRAQPDAQRKALQVRFFLAKSLPRKTVFTDRFILERMLGNLLSNAIRYCEKGGVLISLRRAHGNDGLWLDVLDTGIGIAAPDQARIFNPYVQLGNEARDRTKGLGLGLSIVKRSCDLLNMNLELVSIPGRGSRFRLHIPAILTRIDRKKPTQDENQTSTENESIGTTKGLKIVVIDDDPMIQIGMNSLLTSWGVDVKSATVGDISALNACPAGWTPDYILCDFRLPGKLDGIDMLSLFRASFPHVRGILQTGELAQSVQAKAEQLGFKVMFKPIEASALARALNQTQ
jgi:signal transduction histidine kinase/CheY-like chemotaxis protein